MPSTLLQTFNAEKQDFIDFLDAGIDGEITVRDVLPAEDYASDEYDSDDEELAELRRRAKRTQETYTVEDINHIRVILLTKRRRDLLKRAYEFYTGEFQASGFNARYSAHVHHCFQLSKIQLAVAKSKDNAVYFDFLVTLTWVLYNADTWMQLHYGDGSVNEMVDQLAKMWREFKWKDSNVDEEYTKPGAIALLEDFKAKVEEYSSEPPFRFDVGDMK